MNDVSSLKNYVTLFGAYERTFVVRDFSHNRKIETMNSAALRDEWYEQKNKLKSKFVFLNDSDLAFEEGGKEPMLHRLRIMLGKSKEEMLKIIALL